ncbi:MAG: cysteine--tRNA ligase [Pseudolabrys sp.]|nr:cysteine--tRNA ligase [Pseudolabrys sp.]
MELKLYDTLTRSKRVFAPLDPTNVRMYVCGPTVYDFAHIGNARPVIVFDALFRLLRHVYGEAHVTYVRNVTDVDDKINARAAERGVSIRALTEETYARFKEDVRALGCLEPTVEPRATEYVVNPSAKIDMVRLIERLIAGGNAYVAEGHVLFAVSTMPDYGKLSRRSLDEMEAGARVEVAPYKRHPMDFVLWKPSKPGEPAWDSPWGRGRPGWHIECSAMSGALLGETFDIHGGGIDLVFPHHENEIAQSRSAFRTPMMANFWLHNGFLQVEGEKMAKSLGNFVTIRDLLKDWPGEVIRLNMLRTHYRQPMDWTTKGLEESRKVLAAWYEIVGDDTEPEGHPDPQFLHALCDDLNTPAAVTELHRIAGSLRGHASGAAQLALKRALKASAMLLGLLTQTRREFIASDPRAINVDEEKVASLIQARAAARRARNFAESDRIRDELARMGVVLKDGKDGTTWEIAR